MTTVVGVVVERNGAEAVQVYIGAVDSNVERPLTELRGFAKTETVSVDVGHKAFQYFDEDADDLAVDYDEFEVSVVASSCDVRATGLVHVKESVQQPTATIQADGETASATEAATEGSPGGSVSGFGAAAVAVASPLASANGSVATTEHFRAVQGARRFFRCFISDS